MEVLEGFSERLGAWATETLGGVEATFDAPSHLKRGGECVSLYALGIEDLIYRHGTTGGRPPLGFRFRYLVTTWAANLTKAQKFLGELVLSAMEESDYDVELSGVDTMLWHAFGIPPRPAFFLLVSVQKHRPTPLTPRIQEPPRVQASLTAPLVGRVTGPGELPLMQARVEIPSLDQATHTDADGRFRFAALPTDPTGHELWIHARGFVKTLTLEKRADGKPSQPLLVQFEL